MNSGPQQACLAIADVSGYTGYLAGVELDHAQDILADLIGTIVEALQPFQLSKLEGDASFVYLPGDSIDGSTLQDAIEGTYIAFRSRLRDIQQASSCECNACIRIPSLDLKFVVHFGAIAIQRMVGMEELVGSDVIVVHRLLKNTIIEDTGVSAYAFYTQAAMEAADIDPVEQGLVEHHEAIDVAGDVQGWVRDLEARWQDELARPQRTIASEDLFREFSWEAATPPAVTFDYLTSPRQRLRWDPTLTGMDEETDGGRRGEGTTNHCLHGEAAVREQILAWRPPHYWLLHDFAASIPGEPSIYISDELSELPDGGTRVINRVGRVPGDGADAAMSEMVFGFYDAEIRAKIPVLQQILEEVAAEQATAPSVEPPRSAARHLQEPVVAER